MIMLLNVEKPKLLTISREEVDMSLKKYGMMPQRMVANNVKPANIAQIVLIGDDLCLV